MNSLPLCPQARQCGGCQLQGLPYPEQLKRKQRRAEELLGHFAPVLPIIGMEDPAHCRYKALRSFGLDSRRRPVCGVYRQGSHAIVPVEACPMEAEAAGALFRDLWALLPDFKIPVYDERSGSGFLRHALVRQSRASGRLMLTLVAASPAFKAQKPFIRELTRLHPELSTVVLNINDRFGPVVLGKREKLLYGSGYLEDSLCSKRFRLSSRSFFQVNPVQTEKLYAEALAFAGLTGRETVLDAYCGVGTIGICAADRAGQVVGVELNRDAVGDAIANARLNGLKNARFYQGDAGEFMEQMAGSGRGPDLVFMDPPRSGSDRRFIASLLRAAPEKVVYISCSPESLRRDLEQLCAGGYRVRKLRPVDMFPFTEHIETICLLSRARSA